MSQADDMAVQIHTVIPRSKCGAAKGGVTSMHAWRGKVRALMFHSRATPHCCLSAAGFQALPVILSCTVTVPQMDQPI